MHPPSFPPPTAKEVVTAPRTLKTAPRALIKMESFHGVHQNNIYSKKLPLKFIPWLLNGCVSENYRFQDLVFIHFFFMAGVRVNHHDSDLYSGYARTRKNLAKIICLQSYYIAHFLKFSFCSCMEELELIFFRQLRNLYDKFI